MPGCSSNSLLAAAAAAVVVVAVLCINSLQLGQHVSPSGCSNARFLQQVFEINLQMIYYEASGDRE